MALLKEKRRKPRGCFQARRLGDFRCLERALLRRKTERWMGSILRREWFHPKLSSCGRISEYQATAVTTIRRANACLLIRSGKYFLRFFLSVWFILNTFTLLLRQSNDASSLMILILSLIHSSSNPSARTRLPCYFYSARYYFFSFFI